MAYSLADKGLSDILASSMPTENRVRILLLERNKLAALRGCVDWPGSKQVDCVAADDNRFVSLTEFSVFTALRWLSLKENFVTARALSMTGQQLPPLAALSLEGNAVEAVSLPESSLPLLHWLDLSRNPLRRMVS
jgi:Leucine-rich repeat (LRR) protein